MLKCTLIKYKLRLFKTHFKFQVGKQSFVITTVNADVVLLCYATIWMSFVEKWNKLTKLKHNTYLLKLSYKKNASDCNIGDYNLTVP